MFDMSDSSKLDRIDAKIDDVHENITQIKVTLAAQHESLKTHIRRTDLLEKKLEPLEKHVTMVQGSIKLIGFVAICFEIWERFKDVW